MMTRLGLRCMSVWRGWRRRMLMLLLMVMWRLMG